MTNGQPEGVNEDSLPEVSQLSHLNEEQESCVIDESHKSNQNLLKPVSNCTLADPSSLEATESRCSCWVANAHSTDEATLECNSISSTISLAKFEMVEKSDLPDPEADDAEPEPHQNDEGEKGDPPFIPKKSRINENASPFYPSGYIPPSSPMFMQHSSDNPPTLYLYSPGNQSIVPCDEIVMTSPIIAPDGTALFPTSSNVYLPFDGMMNGLQYLGTQVTPSGLIQYDQVREVLCFLL